MSVTCLYTDNNISSSIAFVTRIQTVKVMVTEAAEASPKALSTFMEINLYAGHKYTCHELLIILKASKYTQTR